MSAGDFGTGDVALRARTEDGVDGLPPVGGAARVARAPAPRAGRADPLGPGSGWTAAMWSCTPVR
ncbi:hypothetical protein [Streptomyces sp. NPDC003697]